MCIRDRVQRVCRPNHTFRGFQGQIESGQISVGDEIVTLPSKEHAKVKSLLIGDKDVYKRQINNRERTEDKMYVEMRNIYKQYGNFRASDNVSFGIEKGKLAALLGPSGSGKTTLLRMIAGLENPNAGDIFIDGKRVNDIPAAKRGIGFVFQSYALFRYMTVFDNIAFGLEIAKMPKKQIKERVFELLELTGLSGLENRYPNQLSGGQRQRVAFARALAPNPQVLLLDEPFAAIDAKVRSELRLWLKEMVSKLGITSIFVTHDPVSYTHLLWSFFIAKKYIKTPKII